MARIDTFNYYISLSPHPLSSSLSCLSEILALMLSQIQTNPNSKDWTLVGFPRKVASLARQVLFKHQLELQMIWRMRQYFKVNYSNCSISMILALTNRSLNTLPVGTLYKAIIAQELLIVLSVFAASCLITPIMSCVVVLLSKLSTITDGSIIVLQLLHDLALQLEDNTRRWTIIDLAHVGVALLNAVPPTTQSGALSSGSSKTEDPKSKTKKSKPVADGSKALSLNGEGSSRSKPPVSRSDSSSSTQPASNRHLTPAELQKLKVKKLMDELNEDSGDGRTAPVVKLGDASMASPFTAKHASVAPTTDIIRQGRSTLVTTLQMFKILGLNCLATAYVLSVMYLDGVKLGDVQATISGVFTAAFFLFISHARPLPTLSEVRPHPNIFCSYVFLSLLGQFSLHILFLIFSVKEAEKYMPDECIEPDSEFHPNLVNTVSYMVGLMLQVATFAVNYMGHPFNQSISENKPFRYALVAGVVFFSAITSDLFRDLNDWLKLVPLPSGLRDKLLIWAFLMFMGCYMWERLLRWAFPGKMPAWKKRQRLATANLEKKKRL
ncbi:Probable manganese-transporting ATPase pdr2 [Dionaea muscipula]